MANNIEIKAVNTMRFLAVDAIEKANSGHPGLPMGGSDMAYVLWSRFLKHSPEDPTWPDRDRFVLSAGHGSMLLYSLLHLFGYNLSIEEIKDFRQWGSKTPGHPEYGHTEGVEITTGPLGQGFASAVGMAIGERRLSTEFNKPSFPVVDHYTYVYSGDGCMMEGITSEAASLAGHLKLGKLICFYDDNQITIDGSTEITFTEDVEKRFAAYGWQVLRVDDGRDHEGIAKAIVEARVHIERPSLIMVRTEIGYGSPNKQGKSDCHGAPIGSEETRLSKENLGCPPDKSFYVSEDVRNHFGELITKLNNNRERWNNMFKKYRDKYPEMAKLWNEWHRKELPPKLVEELKSMKFEKDDATRSSSGTVLQVLAGHLPNLMGGSADLAASVKTYLKGKGDFQADTPGGNNIHFGVREHAMGAILSGLALHGGIRPFGSTFFVFSDYMKPAIRLASLMGLPVVYVFTHDSIAVGEDGPTHQPVEHLANLRSIPNLNVLRPADGKETAMAWLNALERTDGPTALILSRQNLPQLTETGADVAKGAYVLVDDGDNPHIIILASGSEVSLAIKAEKELKQKGVKARVVSMISWELFEKQPADYRQQIIPRHVTKRLLVEAALPMGWEKYVGPEGRMISVNGYLNSAPGEFLMEKAGFTVQNIVQQAMEMLS